MKTITGVVTNRGYQTVEVEVDDDTPESGYSRILQENFNPAKADWESEAYDIEEIK